MTQKHKKNKSAPQQTFLFGIHAVQEAWLNAERHIQDFYITEKMLGSFEDTQKRAEERGIKRPKPQIIDRKFLDKKLKGAVHQGIAVLADPLPEFFLQDLIIKTHKKSISTILVLDQVTDPHNVGAIIRSASAFGADGIVMQRRHAPELSGVLVKVACGAAEHIPVVYEINLSRAIESLQQAGYKAIGLDEHTDTSIGKDVAGMRTALVLGAEGKGLRPSIKEQCDMLAKLPTQGAIQSLNVSNAAAVALYAVIAK